MNAYFGADTEALRATGSALARRADLLGDLEWQLTAVIESTEWIGADADAFRADWAGRVRPALQDSSLDIRHRARRLLQHADEQDHASSPDSVGGAAVGGGVGGGIGGGPGSGAAGIGAGVGISTGGQGTGGSGLQGPLAQMGRIADGFLRALAGERSTPFQQLLGGLLDSPAGREGLISGLVGGMLAGTGGGASGGGVSEMLGHAVGGGLGEFLTGLGIGQGLGSALGQGLLGGAATPGLEGVAAGAPGTGTAGDGASDTGSAGEPATNDATDGSSAGGGSGESGSSGSDSGGADSTADTAGAEGAPTGGGTPIGVQGIVAGAESVDGAGDSGARIDGGAYEEGGGSVLDSLLALLGDIATPGSVAGAHWGGAAGSEAIGNAAIDVRRI